MTYKELIDKQRTVGVILWSEVPECLRLDPARAVQVYGDTQRGDEAAERFLSRHGCMYATNSLMRHWGYDYFEKCKMHPRPGYKNICTHHFKIAPARHGCLLISDFPIMRGEMDPDLIEQEWASVMDRIAQFDTRDLCRP